MKIGIMGTRGIPNNYGGFEQFAQTISLGLLELGHEVAVYNSESHPFRGKVWNGVQIIHCKDPENKMGTVGQFFYDLNCIRDARKRNFDVLFHFGYSSDSFWWRRWPKNTINIMNMDGLEWKRTKYNRLTRQFLKWAESLAARKANILVADSPAIREYISQRYGIQPVYIPYPAEVFTSNDPDGLEKYELHPGEYFLLVARMERENNVEMIIQGYLASGHAYPLFIIGSTANPFGKWLAGKYHHAKVRFAGPLYDRNLLDDLRFFSSRYFHGHSVGGTNPSLLEAMACGCMIAAHDNIFNKAVLQGEADYFSTAADLSRIINKPKEPVLADQHRALNIEKIRTIYNPEKIINAYGELIRNARR